MRNYTRREEAVGTPYHSVDPFAKVLLKLGFEEDGWGSPITRKEKNTTVLTRYWESPEGKAFDFVYFPVGWEGTYTGHISLKEQPSMIKTLICNINDITFYRRNVTNVEDVEQFIKDCTTKKTDQLRKKYEWNY